MARRLTAVVPLLALAATAIAAAAAGPSNLPPGEGFLYTRPVVVPAKGWVRVPLDLTTLRHLTPADPAGGDLRVFSPGGGEVASRVAPYLPGAFGRVESAPDPSLAITSRETDCEHPGATLTVCRLVLPASGQVLRRLMLDVGRGGGAEVGYRVYEPRDSRWRQLAEGAWPASDTGGSAASVGSVDTAGGGREIALPPGPVTGDTLRLELYGKPAPELKSFSAELAIEAVLFQAEETGTYTLAYGGSAAGRKDLPRSPQSSRLPAEETAWLSPGPEEEHAPPPLPGPAVEPGNPLGETRFALSLKLAAPEARPGSLVRLEVPAAAYGSARPDLGDLRLAASGRQIPYLRWTPPVPVLVRETAAQPVRSWDRRSAGGASRIDLDLPQTGLPLTQLLLTAPPMPLRRGLSLLYDEPARPGVGAGERVVARGVWQCLSRPPLPCRTLLALDGRAPRLLTLRFEDGDNPPLGSLDLSLWRRADVLVFVWPERGDVRLLAGARDLQAPDYDLAALGDQLLSRPWRPAEIDRSGSAAPAPRWARWVMPVTLGLATLLLFFLLRRVLRTA
ncbi:MAG TPA: hypothetical protein VGR07_13465 [Thermoanaerobaculia bacterium]|nr:hypothetical protein [Thermoanaerobaculia bacterium]